MIAFNWQDKRLILSNKMLGGVAIYFLLTLIPVVGIIAGAFKTIGTWCMDNLGWMYWTLPSGLFFGGLFLAIFVLGIWDVYHPHVNRKGFFPMATSPGDRLFIGIISTIGIHLIWLALFQMAFLWVATLLSIAWFYIESRWG